MQAIAPIMILATMTLGSFVTGLCVVGRGTAGTTIGFAMMAPTVFLMLKQLVTLAMWLIAV